MVRFGLLAFVLCGCDFVTNTLTSSFQTNDFSGDPYPIFVDSSSGGIVLGMREGTTDHTAVLDVLSPLTLVDRGPDTPISKTERDLTVLGERGPGGPADLPRARIPSKSTITLHPCGSTSCAIGRTDDPRFFDAVFGLDTFAGDALRLRLGSDEIFVLPDIAGSEVHRTRSCDAVFPQPYRGGGTLVLGGTEVGFSNFRIAIDTCIAPKIANTTTQNQRGVDALLVASTALGPTILNASTYERYHQFDPTTPELATLPVDLVYLPSGPITGRLTDMPSIALVGNFSGNPRAPCRQVWASHLLAAHDCEPGDDCPCGGGATYCGAPAIVELAPLARIPVLVVDDADPVLQALRAELRPDRPEVDGILGTDALRALELDIDYAHDRMMARCTDRTVCAARGILDGADRGTRFFVNGCLGDQPGPIQ